MNAKIRLKDHARQRLAERTSLTEEEFITILDSGNTELVSRNGNKKNILLYSALDKQCFVAVVDEKTSEVITLLFPEHDRDGRVPYEMVNQLVKRHNCERDSTAQKIVSPVVTLTPEKKWPATTAPSIFKLRVRFDNEETQRSRYAYLKIPVATYPDCMSNLEKLQNIPAVATAVREFIETQLLSGEWCCEDVYVVLGSSSHDYIRLIFPTVSSTSNE